MFSKTLALLAFVEEQEKKRMVIRISRRDITEGDPIEELKTFLSEAKIVQSDYDINTNELIIFIEKEETK